MDRSSGRVRGYSSKTSSSSSTAVNNFIFIVGDYYALLMH